MRNYAAFVANSRPYFRIGIAGSTEFRDTEEGFKKDELKEACKMLGQKLYHALGANVVVITGGNDGPPREVIKSFGGPTAQLIPAEEVTLDEVAAAETVGPVYRPVGKTKQERQLLFTSNVDVLIVISGGPQTVAEVLQCHALGVPCIFMPFSGGGTTDQLWMRWRGTSDLVPANVNAFSYAGELSIDTITSAMVAMHTVQDGTLQHNVATAPVLSLMSSHRVSLEKQAANERYGFSLAQLHDGSHVVADVTDGSIAHGNLAFGDTIVQINGQNANGLHHVALVQLIHQSQKLQLVVARREDGPVEDPAGGKILTATDSTTTHSSPAQELHRLVFRLQRGEEGFGFGIGTASSGKTAVIRILPGTSAAGSLIVGDRILKINDTAASDATHSDLIGVAASSDVIEITVERLRSAPQTPSLSPASRPHGAQRIKAVIKRTSSTASIGILLASDENGRHVVGMIVPGLPCDGVLKVGDIVKTVNNVAVNSMSQAEVVSSFLSSLEVHVQVEREISGTEMESHNPCVTKGPIRGREVSTARSCNDYVY
eukprot:m.121436 g.121436  ORF g.121436 m.121436 type:complete len:544 (+) comp17269_c0_seq19:354-1985(+)